MAAPIFRRLATLVVVWATLLGGVSVASIAEAQAAPNAPTSCSFIRSGTGSATIVWTPAPDDGADHYIIESERNFEGWTWADRIDVGEDLTSTVDNFAKRDFMKFRVRARTGAVSSQTTICRQVANGPIPPISCAFERRGGSATISWTPALNDGADRYVIEQNRNLSGWQWAARVNVGEPLTATVDNFAAADRIQFRVTARDLAQVSSYTFCNETAVGVPLAPLSCVFERTGTGSATIIWTALPDDGADRYIVERKRTYGPGGWAWAGRVDAGEPLTLTDSAFLRSDPLGFRVTARAGALSSQPRGCSGDVCPIIAPGALVGQQSDVFAAEPQNVLEARCD